MGTSSCQRGSYAPKAGVKRALRASHALGWGSLRESHGSIRSGVPLLLGTQKPL